MWSKYREFLTRTPELRFTWNDPADTGARGWLVINSLRGGAAGGGTRMRDGCDPREVTYLAKAMELKFSLAGPRIGGAKSGIDFDPADPRKREVLERWYDAITPYLRTRYGTGGDLNIDEVTDVIPAFHKLGLIHPQEGVMRGHLRPQNGRLDELLRVMDEGVKAPLPPSLGVEGLPLTVADMSTGWGVAISIRRLFERQGRDLEGVRVMLEGFGNVGAACALYLARFGARLIAIADAEKALIPPEPLGASDVEDLIRRRSNKLLPRDAPGQRRGAARDCFWDTPADVFVAAALSGTLTPSHLDRLAAAGVQVIACGANQPFCELKLGSTRVQRHADSRFSIIADVMANCGMARTFSYLMQPDALPEAEPTFAAIRRTIEDAVDETLDQTGGQTRGLLAGTLAVVLSRVSA